MTPPLNNPASLPATDGLVAGPVPSGIEAIVCADIARRQAHGIAKYGTTVADNPLSLRQWLNHAYEETLDKAVYLRRAIWEIDSSSNTTLSHAGTSARKQDGAATGVGSGNS